MAKRRSSIAADIHKYSRIRFCAVVLRYFFFFYSFISFIFWFLNCFEVDWLYHFNALFMIPYMIVKSFYVPKGVSVDFTLAIIGGISLLIGFLMDLVSNNIQQKLYDLEDEEEMMLAMKRAKSRQTKVPQAQMQEVTPENITEDLKFVFLITPHINKIKRKETDIALTFQEIEIWKQRVNKRLLQNILYSKPMQKGYYRNNLFLVFKDFNYIDDFIFSVNPTLQSITSEFKKYGVNVGFGSVLSIVYSLINLEKELDLMDIILSLKFPDKEIITTGMFRNAYDTRARKQYYMKYKGEYNLSKNLTISNRQPLYELKEKPKKDGTT